jgi:hypothetical protein
MFSMEYKRTTGRRILTDEKRLAALSLYTFVFVWGEGTPLGRQRRYTENPLQNPRG